MTLHYGNASRAWPTRPARGARPHLLATTLILSLTAACAMPHPAPDVAPATPVPAAAAEGATAPGRVVTGEFPDAGGTTGTPAWRLWVPAGHDPRDPASAPRPLVVMLHGCTQDPDDIARGTRLDARADSSGAMVLYPGQPLAAHPKQCWNWYEPAHQRRGAGEPAAIAALTRQVQAEYRADPARTYVAGISAGGAMALISAVAYPELYAAVGVHSAPPWGAAENVVEALGAMARGADAVPAAAARITGVAMAQAMGARARPLPAIVFHGADDKVVAAANGDALVRQLADAWVQLSPGARYAEPVVTEVTHGGRAVTHTVAVGGAVEGWRIAGLGHAWSGGSAHGSYTDEIGPDATAAMLRFLLSHRMTAATGTTGAGQ